MEIQFFVPFPKYKWPPKLKEYGLWIFHYLESYTSPPHIKDDIFRAYGFYVISHLIEGKGWYYDEYGKSSLIEEGDCVLVTPGAKHGFGGLNTAYKEDYICFCGSIADNLLASGIIEPGVIRLGNIRKLLLIIESASISTTKAQFQANLELINLLHELHSKHNNKSHNYNSSQRVRTVIDEVSKDPQKWWKINEMADISNLSVSQFRRVFKNETGLNPKQYVMEFKIKSIVEKLNVDSSILHKVVYDYGFQNFSHFSRLFKHQTGYTPSVYCDLCKK